MFQLMNSILLEFRNCFKRTKTWRWFVIIIIGFMVRMDNRGVTSIISALRLKPCLYHNLLHFFRSNAYRTNNIFEKWIMLAMKYSNIKRVANRIILLGDHSKVSKEGVRMPGVQTMYQDSQNSGKASYIEGHNIGQISAVITDGHVSRSIPLITELQTSPKTESDEENSGSLVSQMIALTHRAAKAINEPVYVALDAYFSSSVAWLAADETMMENGVKQVEIITRGQSNTVAYTETEITSEKKRGRPRKYGEKILLRDLFAETSRFTETTMMLYGKSSKVRYLCVDLIWKPVKRLVRFVLTITNSGNCILMSSDFTLDPESIISIYAMRFKIETSFDEQKNDMGGFCYHFWTTALEKRKKWKKVIPPDNADNQQKIQKTIQATETFICLNTIATGLLTLIAFSHNREIWNNFPGWVRTLRSHIPTIATSKQSFSHVFNDLLQNYSSLSSFNFIIPLLRGKSYWFNFAA